jgi:hypothetical protein
MVSPPCSSSRRAPALRQSPRRWPPSHASALCCTSTLHPRRVPSIPRPSPLEQHSHCCIGYMVGPSRQAASTQLSMPAIFPAHPSSTLPPPTPPGSAPGAPSAPPDHPGREVTAARACTTALCCLPARTLSALPRSPISRLPPPRRSRTLYRRPQRRRHHRRLLLHMPLTPATLHLSLLPSSSQNPALVCRHLVPFSLPVCFLHP